MTDWQRVADAVRLRRETLGLNREDGTASASTYYKLENAKQTSYKSFSLRAVEADLGWPAGTIDVIAAGGEIPDPGQPADRVRLLEVRVKGLEETLVDLRDELRAAIEAQRQER